MAKKMDFVEFVSDLPDEEGDEMEQGDLSSAGLNEPIPPGVYYKVSGSKFVMLQQKGCKKQQ